MTKHIASSAMGMCLALALITGCSDNSSLEACQYQTTMDLDKGDYDAVLASSCATPMHVAAAYFGKAGYSVTSVLNTLISAQTTSAARDKALQQYMNVLTGKVTSQTLAFLNNSQDKYTSILPSSELYKAAQFDLSIVLAVKSMSLLKSIIDSAGLGTLSTCNINGNTIPDDADAATCALLVSGVTASGPLAGPCPQPASGPTYSATYSITNADRFFSSTTGTYRGMTVTMATVTSLPPGCSADYKKLLYLTATGKYSVATTSGTCMDTNGDSWPCPVTSQIDLATSVGASIDGTVDALNTALTGTASEVTQAIVDIKDQACGGSTCTAATLAEYLQTRL